jgi:hypothetical protein
MDQDIPGLGELFAMGLMKPTLGNEDLAQPMGLGGAFGQPQPTRETLAQIVRAYRGSSTPYEELSHTRAQDTHGRQNALGWGRGKFYFTREPNIARSYSIMRGAQEPIVNEADLTVRKPLDAAEYERRYRTLAGRGLYEPYAHDYDMYDRDLNIERLDRLIRDEGYDAIADDVGQIAIFEPGQARFVGRR